jgi:hypothetical protein
MLSNEFDDDIRTTLELLGQNGVVFEPGLSDVEVERVEATFGFRFPPDLRAFLQTEMPIRVESKWGEGVFPSWRSKWAEGVFPNWRNGDQAELQGKLDWPFEGLAFDIEHNDFWLEEWKPKPTNLADTVKIARKHVDAAPRLIPICSHRYLPADPQLAGNPVFSVYQTDIIIYGRNLWDYFKHEFDQERG